MGLGIEPFNLQRQEDNHSLSPRRANNRSRRPSRGCFCSTSRRISSMAPALLQISLDLDSVAKVIGMRTILHYILCIARIGRATQYGESFRSTTNPIAGVSIGDQRSDFASDGFSRPLAGSCCVPCSGIATSTKFHGARIATTSSAAFCPLARGTRSAGCAGCLTTAHCDNGSCGTMGED